MRYNNTCRFFCYRIRIGLDVSVMRAGRQICPNDDVSGVRFTTCDPRNRCRVQNRITGDTILITITAGVEAGSLGFTATGGELFSLLSFSR